MADVAEGMGGKEEKKGDGEGKEAGGGGVVVE